MLSNTALYGALLALWFFVLSVMVIRTRGTAHIGLGDGDNLQLSRRIRGHANFAEYTPLILLLMAIVELSGGAAWRIHLIGIPLLLGRLAHGYCFAFTQSQPKTRVLGMALTFAALIIAALNCLWLAFA